jgi:hypothetical protein
MTKFTIRVTTLLAVLFATAVAMALPTQITVRVKTKDAKFLGSSMGGALITIRSVETGELLAKGVTTGSTGNTDTIMKKALTRGMPLSDETSARFNATIDINEPTLVEVKAYGPLVQRQSANTVSATQWVVPGKHIVGGDAFMLELPGLVVDVLAPPAHLQLHSDEASQPLAIAANVTMMCGCPLKPGDLWDATKFEVKALVKKDGGEIDAVTLSYAGHPSQFSGNYVLKGIGTYEITVYAFDPATGNTGVDRTSVVVVQ